MSKSKHVKVVIRTRPTSSFAQDLIQFGSDKKSLHIHIPKNEEWGYINNQQENWDFKFDNILHNASQEVVYEECAIPIVKSLLDGYNATILAYGQTGAGKTFTMTGATENYKHRGLIPRAISQLFHEIADRPQLAFTVRVSYLEIYNEQMVDLLGTLGDKKHENMTVVEEKSGATHVKGLNVQLANNEEEALNLLFEGETNRSISEHQLNRASSRSHCIFTIYVESRSRVESSERVLTSKLNLVDLAGSERLSKTETKGITFKEAMYINRSLTYLEQVIIALSDKKRDHIPFRQSKMTHVLRDSLGGNCNTLMIANVWGEREHIEETISTLRFATRMMCVQLDPEINVQYDPLALIKKYEREIKELKQELSMYDTLSNRSHVHYEPFTELQRQDVQRQIRDYLENESLEIDIINIRQIKETFGVFRTMYKQLESSVEEARGKPASQQRETSEQEQVQKQKPLEPEREEGVGDMEGNGFGIGLAPLNGRRATAVKTKQSFSSPKKSRAPSRLTNSEALEEEEQSIENYDGMVIDQTQGGDKKRGLSRSEEFEIFKKSKGQELNRILSENKLVLKQKRKEARAVADEINRLKDTIDSYRTNLSVLKHERAHTEQETIIDEKEANLLQNLKSLKEQYKTKFEVLRQARSEMDYVSKVTDQSRQKMMSEFEHWFESRYGTIEEKDLLDIGEKFDRLQMEKMSQEDPDSLPFYNAKKNTERKYQKLNRKITVIKPIVTK